MKESTYRKMPQKRPLRRFNIFKYKYLRKQAWYSLLARMHLAREVKDFHSIPVNNIDLLNKVRLVEEKITTDRGIFNLSYFGSATRQISKWYIESLFRHKRLCTICDEETLYIKVEARSECEEFEVHLTPFLSARVHRGQSFVTFSEPSPRSLLVDKEVNQMKSKFYKVDFFNARFAVSVILSDKESGSFSVEDLVREAVQRAKVQIQNYIEEHPAEINKRLVGVDNDGNLTTKEGMPLLPNCLCHKCGRPVFKSSVDGYVSQCVRCDEDLYDFETVKVDPKQYEQVLDNTKIELYCILSEQ